MKKLKKFFKRHSAKFIAVILSMCLWLYVVNSSPIEVKRPVKVKILLPENKALSSNFDSEFTLELSGPRAFVKNLYSQNKTVFFNLQKFKARNDKKYKFRIKEKDLSLPFGVKLKSVSPKSFNLSFSPVASKDLPVRANIVGNLPKEYRLVSHQVIPSHIKVSGPKSVIKKLKFIKTGAIDLGTRVEADAVEVVLDTSDKRFEYDRESVSVNLNIQAKKANLTLKKIPIQFLTKKSSFYTKSKYSSLSVLVDETKNLKITKEMIDVIAEIPARRGNHRVKLKAILPEGVHLVKIYPESILIKVK